MKCKKINKLIITDIIVILFIILAIVLNYLLFESIQTTSPVGSSNIDSIVKDNDKLIIEVEHLDSIKNAKSIEIKSLDNDSTLRLFYQLIGK